jgi:hypothetical protein
MLEDEETMILQSVRNGSPSGTAFYPITTDFCNMKSAVYWNVILCSVLDGRMVTHLKAVHSQKMGTFIFCGYITYCI